MEFLNVFKRRKILLALSAIFLCQLFMFVYSERTKDENNEYVNEDSVYDEDLQEVYPTEYHEYIENIISQANELSGISIFAKQDSFSNANIIKTKEDFLPLINVIPIVFDDEFITNCITNGTVNIMTLLCCIIIALSLVDENTQGLKCMIFSSVNGRKRLAVHRIGALFMWSGIITLFMYGGTLAVSILIHKGNLVNCLGYPIQSMKLFKNMPLCINIGTFLIIYILFKWIVMFAATLLIWTLCFWIDNIVISGGAVAITGLTSYILFSQIGSLSSVNYLKYCNLWYLITNTGFFTEYRNVNINSCLVNKNILIMIVGIILIMGCIFTSIIVASNRYPCHFSIRNTGKLFNSILLKTRHFYCRFQNKLPLNGVEYYKILISQKGILVIVLLGIVLFTNTDFTKIQQTGSQIKYYEFIENHIGAPDDSSRHYLEELSSLVEKEKTIYEEALELYENGELSDEDWMISTVRYDAFASERTLLNILNEQTNYIEDIKNENQIDAWYINEYSYEHLINNSNDISDILVILAVVFLCSGIFAREKKCGMVPVFRCSVNGRSNIYNKKIKSAIVLSSIIYIYYTSLNIVQIASVYQLKGLSAPVQSVPALYFVNINCSIGAFVGAVFIIRLLMVLVIALLTCMFSTKTNQKITLGFSLVLLIPSLLVMMGFKLFKYISIMEVLSVMPFMLETHNYIIVTIIGAGLLVLSIIATRAGYKKWCLT